MRNRVEEEKDTVELMIPLTEALQTAGMKVGVINTDGEFTALEARVEGEYLIVPTVDMGDFVFYTASGDFNWNYQPDNVGPDANKPGGDKDDGIASTGEAITGVLWSVTFLSLSILVLYVTVIKGRKEGKKSV